MLIPRLFASPDFQIGRSLFDPAGSIDAPLQLAPARIGPECNEKRVVV